MRFKVFILGAGCSASYGYPLAVNLAQELGNFLTCRKAILSKCPIIQSAVTSMVGLAASTPRADTLDELVNLAEERFKAGKQQETLTDEQILNAKIATAALFLDRERAARKITLEGYEQSLLPSIFGTGPDWQRALNNSDCSVLTFNYDRLFEIAFLERFPGFNLNEFSLYGKSVLNSGFDSGSCKGGDDTEIAPDRFCFLKLHGSAGWWVRREKGNRGKDECRRYCLDSPGLPTDIQRLEEFLAQNRGCDPWEPLIAFPHEKQQCIPRYQWDLEQGPYTKHVWMHAASVLEKAAEVTVIGYSFANVIDRAHMIENLLSKTPSTSRIVIENKNVGAVKSALKDIKTLEGRLVFKKRTF